MVRPMVHSTKHYVQFPRFTIATVSLVVTNIALAIQSTTANLENEVEEGNSIKACYVELWLLDAGAGGSQVTTLTKNPQNATGPSFTQSQSLFTFANKKNILFTSQGLTPNDGIAQPVNIMRQWYKIPKSKQRFGLGDRLDLNIANSSAQDLFACGFATYKEYQ